MLAYNPSFSRAHFPPSHTQTLVHLSLLSSPHSNHDPSLSLSPLLTQTTTPPLLTQTTAPPLLTQSLSSPSSQRTPQLVVEFFSCLLVKLCSCLVVEFVVVLVEFIVLLVVLAKLPHSSWKLSFEDIIEI